MKMTEVFSAFEENFEKATNRELNDEEMNTINAVLIKISIDAICEKEYPNLSKEEKELLYEEIIDGLPTFIEKIWDNINLCQVDTQVLKKKELYFMDFDDFDNFENFKSNVCHSLKHMDDLPFLVVILQSNKIQDYYKNNHLLECYYLLGMVDYLCHINDLPLDNEYNYIRKYKLEKPVFPAGVELLCDLEGNDEPKKKFLKKAIPEFLQYNIVESDVRDVVS